MQLGIVVHSTKVKVNGEVEAWETNTVSLASLNFPWMFGRHQMVCASGTLPIIVHPKAPLWPGFSEGPLHLPFAPMIAGPIFVFEFVCVAHFPC